MNKVLVVTAIFISCLLLGKDPKASVSKSINQSLTKKELEKLPLLIALSIKETFQKDPYFNSFIDGMRLVEEGTLDSEQEQPEIAAYAQYETQIAVFPSIQKNLAESIQYLRKKQAAEGLTTLIEDRIYYKTLKKGNFDGITNKNKNNVKINFLIRDIDGNLIGGNYSLSGPIQCNLSELISGMANGMMGMRLNEIRQIELHPELVYGIFSDFGEGKAVSITVELVGCEATNKQFSPNWIPVDIAKGLKNCSNLMNLSSLKQAYMSSCGQSVWSFYKKKLQNIILDDVLKVLEAENATHLTSEDKEILHKVQWLICSSS